MNWLKLNTPFVNPKASLFTRKWLLSVEFTTLMVALADLTVSPTLLSCLFAMNTRMLIGTPGTQVGG
jgi:hypothetical protein